MTHSLHDGPGNLGISALDFWWHMPGRLSQDLKVSHHRVHGLFVSGERIERKAGGIALDFADRLKDMLDPQLPAFFRRHGWLRTGCWLPIPGKRNRAARRQR